MIIQFRTPTGKNAVVAWGEVWSEPYSRMVGERKLVTTSFFLKYDYIKPADAKKAIVQTICVNGWGDIAVLASKLKKSDEVVIFGSIVRDDYNSARLEKEVFKIVPEIILPTKQIYASLENQFGNDSSYPIPEEFAQFEPSEDVAEQDEKPFI